MAQRTVLLQKSKRPSTLMPEVLGLVVKPWTMQVLLSLRGDVRGEVRSDARDTLGVGGMTFSELKWRLGVSSKTLTVRLKELTAAGLVEKALVADARVRAEYTLTRKGLELSTILAAMGSWEEKWA